MEYDVEHHFICFLMVCISSLVIYLCRYLSNFLNWIVNFLIVEFKSSYLFILVIYSSSLSNISFAYIFCKAVAYHLMILTVSFEEQVFTFNEVQFTTFFYHGG